MKSYRLYQIDAFTDRLFKGNPAGVVPNADGLTDDQMQQIAREMNISETAFILSADAEDHDVWVRFFTPTTEVPICGHATVSAHYVKALESGSNGGICVQKTGAGLLPVQTVTDGDDYKIEMTQGEISFKEPISGHLYEAVLEALGLTDDDRDLRYPVQEASTGHSKIMVPIRSREKLNSLNPDMAALMSLSKELGCNGYFVFMLDQQQELQSHGRMFAPAMGIPEDPVTGNANGPLGAYVAHHGIAGIETGTFSFVGNQGEAMGRPGQVDVIVEIEDGQPQQVRIRGGAVKVFQTELQL